MRTSWLVHTDQQGWPLIMMKLTPEKKQHCIPKDIDCRSSIFFGGNATSIKKSIYLDAKIP